MRNSKIAFVFFLLVGLGVYAPKVSAQVTPLSACGNIILSGSYQLPKDLTSTGNCLKILVNDVTINLNGFP
jgi:hypothetical protein